MWQSSRNVINTILLPNFFCRLCHIVVCGSAAFKRTTGQGDRETGRQGRHWGRKKDICCIGAASNEFPRHNKFSRLLAAFSNFPFEAKFIYAVWPVKMFVKYNKFPACSGSFYYLLFVVIFGNFMKFIKETFSWLSRPTVRMGTKGGNTEGEAP